MAKSRSSPPKPQCVRFAGMVRVDYAVEGRSTFAFTGQVSSADMLLRSARELEEGLALEFKLALAGREKPLALNGTVSALVADGPDAGAWITFEPSQESALRQLRKGLEAQFVSKLEEQAARSLRAVDKVLELAAYYREVGRDADATQLCRRDR